MEEIWKPVPGYEGIYLASNLGRVMRTAPAKGTQIGRILAPYVTEFGYGQISLRDKDGNSRRVFVHTVVMAAFNGHCPIGKEVNHIDGDKLNNKLENLEYLSRSEHMRHSIDVLGLYKHKRASGKRPIIPDRDVIEIRRLHSTGEFSQMKLSRMFGCSQSSIGRIIRNEVHID